MEEAPTAERAPLADNSQRAIARIIDSGLVVFSWMILTAAWQLLSSAEEPFAERGTKLAVAAVMVSVLVLYETLEVAGRGATIGKRIMKIRVVMARTGERPRVVNAFLRVAPAVVLVATQQFFPFAWALLYSTAGFTTSNRGLVDQLAGTAVIKVED